MRSTVRWMVAGVVTLAVFSAALWVSAAVVLPLWIKSDSDRWLVATSVSVALAAVAALWGAAFAQREPRPGLARARPELTPATTPADDQPDPAKAKPEAAAASVQAEDQPDPAKAKPEASPASASADPAGTGITMHGKASGHGRVYQAGHDQIINEK
jgi:hypothetical protein